MPRNCLIRKEQDCKTLKNPKTSTPMGFLYCLFYGTMKASYKRFSRIQSLRSTDIVRGKVPRNRIVIYTTSYLYDIVATPLLDGRTDIKCDKIHHN